MLGLHEELIEDQLQLIIDRIDAGSGPGLLRIYGGTRPSTGGAETTLLSEHALSSPCAFINLTGGNPQIEFDAVENGTGLADDNATWFRILDSDENFVLDGGVPADMTMNTVAVEIGKAVRVLSVAVGSLNQ